MAEINITRNFPQEIVKRCFRKARRQEFELGRNVLPYMQRFAGNLLPCPECGKTPNVWIVRRSDDEAKVSIKMNCDPMHASERLINCGDWHETLAKAGRSWNARVRGEDVDGRLHRIGCGRGW